MSELLSAEISGVTGRLGVEPLRAPRTAGAKTWFMVAPPLPSRNHAELLQPGSPASEIHPPNLLMLQTLMEMEKIGKELCPKKDTKDYLREARAGAMYGFRDDA